jgi:succinate-semialdehyde dehydrogenase/glutarate-semialdehyde dehydrogenase
MIGINTFNATSPEMPFVGVGDSGIGMAMGSEGILEHMNVKSVFRADG